MLCQANADEQTSRDFSAYLVPVSNPFIRYSAWCRVLLILAIKLYGYDPRGRVLTYFPLSISDCYYMETLSYVRSGQAYFLWINY